MVVEGCEAAQARCINKATEPASHFLQRLAPWHFTRLLTGKAAKVPTHARVGKVPLYRILSLIFTRSTKAEALQVGIHVAVNCCFGVAGMLISFLSITTTSSSWPPSIFFISLARTVVGSMY